MICPVPLLSCPVTITDNGNGKGQKGCDICPLPLLSCPLPLPFDVLPGIPEILESPSRRNSSISRMPGCGPNALPKNWI